MTRFCWIGLPALLVMTTFYLSFYFFEGVGVGDVEFGDGGAAQGFEMGSAA